MLYISNDPGLLLLAERYTAQYGTEWLQCECLLMGSESSGKTLQIAMAPDLVIQIFRQGTCRLEYKTSLPCRYWRLDDEDGQLEQKIRAEIESMVAGMKMLSRMDI